MTTTTVVAGDKCVSVRGVPGGRGYHAVGVYVAVARADGVLTWRLDSNPYGDLVTRFGHRMVVGFRSPAKAERLATQWADHAGLPFVAGVRHGTVAQ